MLVSASALGYEILLMRLLAIVQWHHFAWMVISLALLGYGASGTAIALGRRRLEPHFETVFSVSALLFSVTMVIAFELGQRVPFNPLEIVWDPQQFGYLLGLYLLFMVPFFFAAGCIGLAFTCRQAEIGNIYFFDLTGAGLGALVIIGLLFVLPPQQALPALASLALLGSALVAATAPRSGAMRVGRTVWLAVLAYLLASGALTLRISPYKGLSQALEVVGSGVVTERSSPLGLLTAVASPRIPFRHAPGLSLATTGTLPDQIAIFTDGDAMSVITRFDGDFSKLSWLADTSAALPYSLLTRPKVLALGAGAGGDVLLALYHDAARVDAVELNPQMVDLVRDDFAVYAGHLYDHEKVRIHVGEARSFARRSEGRYDLVQIGLVDSFGVSGSGVQALHENYLYTVEAIGDYLRLLEPGGMLAVTRWLRLPPRDSLKLVATIIAALREAGVGDPGARLAAIRSWDTVTVLAKNGAFSGDEIDAIQSFARSRSFDTAWYPGMRERMANRYNRLERPQVFEGIRALLGERAGAFIENYKYFIAPATDERPYFFHFFKWRVLPELMTLRERGGAGLIEWGYLVLVGALAQAVIAGALLILAPLAWIRHARPGAGVCRTGTYFFLLGLAFLFIEIAFIQKSILFLGHPLYAVAVVLSGFLVFAGLGSALSRRWQEWTRRLGWSPIPAAVAGIVIIAGAWLLILPDLFASLSGLPVGGRIAVTLALIAPLAFCMGMPFPLGLAHVARAAPDFVPWAWGINGLASVVSAIAAALCAIAFGFSVVVMAALGLYVTAAVLLRNREA